MPSEQQQDAASNPGEQALITGLRNGDAGCFEQLVRQYGARMLNVANHIVRNDADTQDCVQEAFLKVLRHIDQFEGRASVGSWLHKIVAETQARSVSPIAMNSGGRVFLIRTPWAPSVELV